MEYQIIEASNGAELAVKVRKKLSDGWELVGGVSVCIAQALGRETVYAQAMLKKS